MPVRSRIIFITLILALSSVAFPALAQQTPTAPAPANPAAERVPPRRMMMRRRARAGVLPALRELNLTDQQRQQARTIMQGQAQSTQSQRQELRQLMQQRRAGTLSADGVTRAQELRKQLRQGRQATHTQLLALLTPEQKTKLEEMRKARRADHERMGRRDRQMP